MKTSIPFGVLVLTILGLVFSGSYNAEIATRLSIICIVVASYRLIATMGRWSFAHAQIVGLGGYISAIMVKQTGLSFWLGLLMAGLGTALFGLVISYPVLRTRGFYFFMSTYVIGQSMIWVWSRFTNPFGGSSGIIRIPRPDPISIPVLGTITFGRVEYACLALTVMLVSLLILHQIEKTRLGSIVRGIASNVELSRALGTNVMKYETTVLVVSSFFCGIAGALFVHHSSVCHPSEFGFTLAVNILLYTIVGGYHSFWGPILGAAALVGLGEAIRGYGHIVPLVYGVILLVVVLISPRGLVGIYQRIKLWIEGYLDARVEKKG